MRNYLKFLTVVMAVLSLIYLANARPLNPADRSKLNEGAAGILPASAIGADEIAANAISDGKIADGRIVAADLTNACVTPAKASTELKTKLSVATVGGLATNNEKYIFVAPYACTIVNVKLVSDTATADSNVGTNWSFQVANLTVGSNICSAAKVTTAAEMAENTAYDLGANQHLALAEGNVLEVQATKTGLPTDLETAEIVAVVEYY